MSLTETNLTKICPNNNILVWTTQPEKEVSEIGNIEGVSNAKMVTARNPIFVTVDPRYDIKEIAAEIERLLTAEVPDVFKEA